MSEPLLLKLFEKRYNAEHQRGLNLELQNLQQEGDLEEARAKIEDLERRLQATTDLVKELEAKLTGQLTAATEPPPVTSGTIPVQPPFPYNPPLPDLFNPGVE